MSQTLLDDQKAMSYVWTRMHETNLQPAQDYKQPSHAENLLRLADGRPPAVVVKEPFA